MLTRLHSFSWLRRSWAGMRVSHVSPWKGLGVFFCFFCFFFFFDELAACIPIFPLYFRRELNPAVNLRGSVRLNMLFFPPIDHFPWLPGSEFIVVLGPRVQEPLLAFHHSFSRHGSSLPSLCQRPNEMLRNCSMGVIVFLWLSFASSLGEVIQASSRERKTQNTFGSHFCCQRFLF